MSEDMAGMVNPDPSKTERARFLLAQRASLSILPALNRKNATDKTSA